MRENRSTCLVWSASSTLLALLTLASQCLAAPLSAPATSRPAPSHAEIDALIKDLASSDFHVRDAADHDLRELAWPSMMQLVVALRNTSDFETRPRIDAIAQDIVLHHHTGLPEADAQSVNRILHLPVNRRDVETRGGSEGAFTVLQLALVQGDRVRSFHRWGDNDGLAAYLLRLEQAQQWDELEWALITAIALDNADVLDGDRFGPGLLHIASQKGNASQLIDVLTLLQGPESRGNGKFADLILQLARTSGDSKRFLKLCADQPRSARSYLVHYLASRNDWDSIVALPDVDARNLFDRAAALQFSGHTAEADGLLTYRGQPFERNVVNVSGFHPALLGRSALALQLFQNGHDYLDAVQYCLWRHDYAQAFSLVKQSAGANVQDAGARALTVPALVRLNEIDRARHVAHDLADPQDRNNAGWVTPALQEAFIALDDDDALHQRGEPVNMPVLFRSRTQEAAIWLAALQAQPMGDASAGHKTQQILAGNLSPTELASLGDHIPTQVDQPQPRLNALQYFPSLTEAYALYLSGRKDRAQQLLAATSKTIAPLSLVAYRTRTPFEPECPLARLLSLKDWTFVRPLLEATGSKPTADPAFAFLLGLCRERLGDPSGLALRADATVKLSADPQSALFVAEALQDAGEPDLAAALLETAIDGIDPWSALARDSEQLAAQLEQSRGHYAQALNHWRQLTFIRFHYFQMPDDTTIYLRLPRNAAFCQAMLALQQNHRQDFLPAALQLPALDPEDLDLSFQLLPALQQKGWAPEAAALAAAHRAALNAILKDFPNSHLHHFLLARINAQMNDPAAARADLATALWLAPKNPDYLALQSHLPAAP